MAEEFQLTEEMKAAIGVESKPWPYEVTTTSVRAFARGVGYTDRIYYDEDFAKSQGFRSLPMPPTLVATPVFDPEQSDHRFSGPRGVLPHYENPFKRLLDGGTETEYFDTICAGDKLTATSKITDMRSRPGQLGTMLFTTTETTFRNGEGKVVAIQRGTSITY